MVLMWVIVGIFFAGAAALFLSLATRSDALARFGVRSIMGIIWLGVAAVPVFFILLLLAN